MTPCILCKYDRFHVEHLYNDPTNIEQIKKELAFWKECEPSLKFKGEQIEFLLEENKRLIAQKDALRSALVDIEAHSKAPFEGVKWRNYLNDAAKEALAQEGDK